MIEKINIPNSVHDMNLSHLPFYLELAKLVPDNGIIPEDTFNNLDILQVSDFCALFFSQSEGYFDKFTHDTNRNVLAEIAISSSKYNPSQPLEVITVNGIEYVMSLDFSKQPVCFHRDISQIEFKKNPADLLAFCYIEKGYVYNQIDDKTKVIINERKDRAKILSEYFNLASYLDVQGFFLESWNALAPYLKVKKAKRKSINGIGKKQ